MAKYSWGKKKKARSKMPVDPEFEEKLRNRRALGIEGLPEGEMLMNTATFSRVQIDAALAQARADGGEPDAPEEPEEVVLEAPADGRGVPTGPEQVAALEREMMAAKDRDGVASIALRIATYYAQAAALFAVGDGVVTGLRSAGEVLESGIEAVMVPADTRSVICTPAKTGKACRASTPLGDLDARVLRALGRARVREVLVLPVCVDEAAVNLLYADNGAEAVPDTSVGALRILAQAISRAYARLPE